MKRTYPTEAQEQEAVIEYCDWQHIPIFHIPNGGSRHPAEALNLKRQGVRAGVPDLCIPVARGGYHALFIEMKAKRGRLSSAQAAWLQLLRDQGMAVHVCFGADEAIAEISQYVSL